MAVSCGGSGPRPNGSTGRVVAAVSVTGSLHDVVSVAFKVVNVGDTCDAPALARTTISLASAALDAGGASDAGTGHVTVENTLVLAPGTYRVCATPLAANGQPSAFCGSSQTVTTVVTGGVAEVTLVSQCTGDVNGTVVFNDPPEITGLLVPPAGTLAACVPAAITVAATDPDGDALTYAWAVTSGPAGATIDGAAPTATFTATAAGAYEVKVTVSDPLGASTALTFPVAVSAGSCGGIDAAAGTTGTGGGGGAAGAGMAGTGGASGSGGTAGAGMAGAGGSTLDGGAPDGGTPDGGVVLNCRDVLPNWAGDFDGDGIRDCAQGVMGSTAATSSIAFYKGFGGGLYAASAVLTPDIVQGSFSAGTASPWFALDVNGDGRADIAVHLVDGSAQAHVVLALGRSDGTFVRPASIITFSYDVTALEPQLSYPIPGDFNGDGVPDLVLAAWANDANHVVHWLTLLTADPPSNLFNDTSSGVVAGAHGTAGMDLTADLDHDGKLDAIAIVSVLTQYQIVANNDFSPHPQLSVAMGNGDGSFRSPSTLIPGTDGVSHVSASDANGDGKLDLLATLPAGVTTFYGDGAGNFSATPPP